MFGSGGVCALIRVCHSLPFGRHPGWLLVPAVAGVRGGRRPRAMDAGTWLDAPPSAALARRYHLACIWAGICQKPGANFAADVEKTSSAISALCELHAKSALVGGTLILLRQVHALRGQGVVSAVAESLHTTGRVWDRRALRDLAKLLEAMPKADAGRSRGRLVQHSGPVWIRTLLAVVGQSVWSRAASCVGRFFDESAVAAPQSLFYAACEALLGKWKLPGMGRYSVVSLARCGCTCRLLWDGVRVDPCERAWATHVRNMSATTAGMFNAAGVQTLNDARGMQHTVLQVAREMHSSSTSSKYGNIMLHDVALQACEVRCALGVFAEAAAGESPRWRAVAKGKPRRRLSDAAGMEWFLKRVPANASDIRAMAKRMRLIASRKCRDRQLPGEDFHSAAAVAASWVADRPPVAAVPVFGGPRGNQKAPWCLPQLVCGRCGVKLALRPLLRPVKLCRDCKANGRLVSERLRKAGRRHAVAVEAAVAAGAAVAVRDVAEVSAAAAA